MPTPFEILGVSDTATYAEIKAAYRRRAMQLHPDRGGSEEAFNELATAYKKTLRRPCEMCGGKGIVFEKNGFFKTKKQCPKCWSTKE